MVNPSGDAWTCDWSPQGAIGLRTETHFATPPVHNFMIALHVAAAHGWKPMGTSEPGGWTISSVSGQYRVRKGSYVLTNLAKPVVIQREDALELSLALSRALRGERPLHAVKGETLLLGGLGEQNIEVVRGAGGDWSQSRTVLAQLARLMWRGEILIVDPRTLTMGYWPA